MHRTASRAITTVALFILNTGALRAQSTGRAFTPADWYRVVRVAAPVLSPDGNTIAFTVTTVREAEDKRHSEVWIQPVAGGPSRRMTSPGFESSA